MGGVQIKNATAVPLKVQLCQVGVLYHDLVKPGEYFTRDTGAVHFTIVVTVSGEDNTGWTDVILPIFDVSPAIPEAIVAASASIGLFAGDSSVLSSSTLVADGLVCGTVVKTETGVLTAGGVLLTSGVATKLFSEAKMDHCYISSPGWYFGGENHLEILGGPQILASYKGFEYSGTSLFIFDKNDRNRHS